MFLIKYAPTPWDWPMALLHLQLLDNPEMFRNRYAMLFHTSLMLLVYFSVFTIILLSYITGKG